MKNLKLCLLGLIVYAFSSCNNLFINSSNSSIIGKAYYSNCDIASEIFVYLEQNGISLSYTQCDENGNYQFTDLPSGNYAIYATSASSLEKIIKTDEFELADNYEININDIKLTATGNISGKITLDNSEDKNAGLIVSIAGTSYVATTSSDGSFLISNVPAGQNYQLILLYGTNCTLLAEDVLVEPFKTFEIEPINFEKDILSSTFSEDSDSLKGEKGDQGEKGEKGDTGPAGKDGIDGKDSILKAYEISYNLNGGVLSNDSPLYHIYGINTILGTPIREGFSFIGWYLDEDFSGKPIKQINASSQTENLIFYARWTDSIASDVTELNGKLSLQEKEAKILILDEYPDFNILSEALKANKKIKVDLDLTLCDLTNIPEKAFNGVTNLRSVTLPSKVQVINSNAFYGCTSLCSISPLNNITTISSYAFYNCAELKEIELSEKLTTLKDNAFAYSGLTSISIPSTITTLSANLFDNCTKLTDVKLPNNLKTIGNSVFAYCTNLESISIPETVTSFGQYVFNSCTKLKSFSFSDTVTSIGKGIFAACSSLQNVSLPSYLKTLPEYIFAGTGLTEYTIPETIETIGEAAFQNCTKLTSITIPSSLKQSSKYAFYHCEALNKVIIPDIETWLSIYFPSSQSGDIFERGCSCPIVYAKHLYIGDEELTNIVIPEGVTKINSYAFANCESIKYVTIPSTLKEIGNAAFAYCQGIQIVYISDIASWCNLDVTELFETMPTAISSATLYLNNKPLVDLVIPEGVKEIKPYVFAKCTSLKTVKLPSTLERIYDEVFFCCTNISSITIPKNCNRLGSYLFYGCDSLKSITFEDTSDWYKIYDQSRFESGSFNTSEKISVTDASTNAKKLTTDSNYYEKYFYKN